MHGTVACAEVSILSAEFRTLALALWVSALGVSLFVPVISSGLNVVLEFLLQVRVSIQVASCLVRSDGFGTVWVSAFEETPSEVVLLGCLLWCVIVSLWDVAVSGKIAVRHLIIHIWHAVLVTLLLTSELYPVMLGCLDLIFTTFKSLLEVSISINIALGLLIVNVFIKHEVISPLHNHLPFVSIVLASLLAVLSVKAWAKWVKLWVTIGWGRSSSHWFSNILGKFDVLNEFSDKLVLWISAIHLVQDILILNDVPMATSISLL
jgi:hypothetical protein